MQVGYSWLKNLFNKHLYLVPALELKTLEEVNSDISYISDTVLNHNKIQKASWRQDSILGPLLFNVSVWNLLFAIDVIDIESEAVDNTSYTTRHCKYSLITI